MNGTHTPKPLDFPVDFERNFVAWLNDDCRNQAHEMFGPPTLVEDIDGVGMADYWSFGFSCGLQIVYEFLHNGGKASIYADVPEFDHVVRHLPFPSSIIKPGIESGDLAKTSSDFQVWRQGDDGNEMTVGEPTSKRDAKCWVKELESHGHKQTYWYRKS